MTFHKWAIQQRTRLTTHPADPFDAAKVGAALARPGQGKRKVEGIAILTTSRVLVDDTGVRQLGALASALAKQTAERAQEQQDTVLEEAQQLDLDPPLPPAPAQQRPPPAQPAHSSRPALIRRASKRVIVPLTPPGRRRRSKALLTGPGSGRTGDAGASRGRDRPQPDRRSGAEPSDRGEWTTRTRT